MRQAGHTILALALAAAPLAARNARAEETEPVVEPIALEKTLPGEPGEHVLRFTADLSRSRIPGGRADRLCPGALLYFGILRGWSGEVGLPYVVERRPGETVRGLGSASLGLKWQVPVALTLPVVLHAEAEIPATGDALAEEGAEYALTLGSAGRSGRFALQGNAGFSIAPRVDGRAWVGGASLAFAAAPGTHLLAEVTAARDVDGGTAVAAVGPGARRALGEGSLAAAVLRGITGAGEDTRVVAQLQWGF